MRGAGAGWVDPCCERWHFVAGGVWGATYVKLADPSWVNLLVVFVGFVVLTTLLDVVLTRRKAGVR
jgi:hypothetical protein